MRYALRNQKKIKEVLGEDILNRIIKSLNEGLKKDLYTMEKPLEETHMMLTVPDADHTTNVIVFYIINRKYDVYHLAFKEFVG